LLVASNQEQAIATPNYPMNYDNNLDCFWTIRAPQGQFIQITFENFSTEAFSDTLQVFIVFLLILIFSNQ